MNSTKRSAAWLDRHPWIGLGVAIAILAVVACVVGNGNWRIAGERMDSPVQAFFVLVGLIVILVVLTVGLAFLRKFWSRYGPRF